MAKGYQQTTKDVIDWCHLKFKAEEIFSDLFVFSHVVMKSCLPGLNNTKQPIKSQTSTDAQIQKVLSEGV